MARLQRSRFISGFTAVAMLACAAALPAQEATLSLHGQRVRLVLLAGEPVVGRLMEGTADSFRLAEGAAPGRSIPASEVRRIEVSTGRHSHAGRGALVGSGVGGALGLLFVMSSDGGYYYTDGEKVAGAIGLTAMAAGVGALIGGLTHSEQWQEVDPVRRPPVSLLVQPATGSVGLRLAFSSGASR